VHAPYPWRGEGVGVELPQLPLRAGQPDHRGVQLDDGHLRDVGVAQRLAYGQPVPAAEDQHPLPVGGEHRVHQRLVIAVLVPRAELQVAVEVEPQVGHPVGDQRHRSGEHDLLVAAALGVHHRIAVELLSRGHLEVVRRRVGVPQHEEDHRGARGEHGARATTQIPSEDGEDQHQAGERVHRTDHQRAP
jgi:hypothetical protein